MVVFTLFFFYLLSLLFIFFISSLTLIAPSRFSIFQKLIFSQCRLIFSSATSVSLVFSCLFLFFIVLNLIANIPFAVSPSLYYFFSFSFSLVLWSAFFILALSVQFYSFLSHMMPYGAPMFLSFLLPVVEIFSQLIRPLTLMIRLSTNLSAGHIMLFMFSYFSLSSSLILSFTFILCVLLFVLEFCISILQAYIFTSLAFMYLSEV